MIVGALIGIMAVCIVMGIRIVQNIIRHNKRMKELERELDKKLEAGKLRLQRYEREVYNKGINNINNKI
jgi:uncharacterized membrane-anchored protein YhcB (DUF1043 family)